MADTVNAVCWLPKVAPATSAQASSTSTPTPPPADAQWSVTVHDQFIEGSTNGGTKGNATGGEMSARFDRRTKQTTTSAQMRVFGMDLPRSTGPGGIANLRRAVEACAERAKGTPSEAVLRDAARELAANDPASASKP